MFKRSLVVIAALVLAACGKETTSSSSATNTGTTDTAQATTTTAAGAVTSSQGTQQISNGLQTPESVLYDASQDVYFISNINGQPLAKDNNGYISKVNPDTLQMETFVSGGKNGVTLNAPKGMALLNGTLYVADIDTVRMFDEKSGAPKGEIAIPGSTFLNDLVSDSTSVYVSDSGMKAGAGGNFEGTGTDAIWQINNNKPSKIASGKDLNRPNGLEMSGGTLWCVTFGSNELYQVHGGKKGTTIKIPKGSLDGLVSMPDGSFLVSSWESNSIFRGSQNAPFTEVITRVTSPADMGYDTKRHRVLVPHFMESKVTIHPLQ